MDAAECGADAGVFFDEVDAAIEIAAAEEDVVEHGGRLIDCRHEIGSATQNASSRLRERIDEKASRTLAPSSLVILDNSRSS